MRWLSRSKRKKPEIHNRVCEKQHWACLELFVIWLLTEEERKELGKLLRAFISRRGLTLTRPLGPSPGDTHSARWTLSEPWKWVTVPVTRACRRPQSCRWHCTGRRQTGPRWPPHSESAGSEAFWLHKEKELNRLKVEIWTHRCLFESLCNFRPFSFVYLWRKECLCF